MLTRLPKNATKNDRVDPNPNPDEISLPNLTAFLVVVDLVAVPIPDSTVNAQIRIRVTPRDVVVKIEVVVVGARGTWVDAIEAAVCDVTTGVGIRADAGALATVTVIVA